MVSVILSMYLLVLSLVPCADDSIQPICNNVDIELHDHNHNHSDGTDDCTPFCTCICCGSVISISPAQQVQAPLGVLVLSDLFTYNFEYSFDYNKGTWHPPTNS